MIGKKFFYKSGMGICILAGVGALLYYGIHRYDEHRVNKRMEQLRQEVYIHTEKNDEQGLKKGKISLKIDFSKLEKINSDIRAWIKMTGVDIDYPVAVSSQNDYYLYHDVDKKKNAHGTLYFAVQSDFASNALIYGHNMKDGSMFGKLQKFGQKEFAQKYPLVYLYTKENTFSYHIIGSFVTDVSADSANAFHCSNYLKIDTPEKLKEFLQQYEICKKYDLLEKISLKDHLLMLSTCEYSSADGRFIVLGKRVKEEKN